MKTRSKAVLGAGAGLLVMAGIVVGVQLLDGSGGGVEEAIEVLPADTTNFTYVNRDAWAERKGVDDIEHDYSEADFERFAEAAEGSSVGTPLAPYVRVMEDAGFSEFDVDWHVTGSARDGEDTSGVWNVYRMDDDLDLGKVVDSMVDAGWSKDDLDGNPRLTVDLADADEVGVAGGYPVAPLMDVTFVEDEHLMIVSPDPEPVLDVVDGDAESLADDDTVDELIGQVDDVELADVRLGEDACWTRFGSQSSLEQQAQAQAQSDMGELGAPEATGYFQEADGDDAVSVGVLLFSSDDAASDDAEAREKWLEDGTDPITATPISDHLDLDSVESDGSSVVARGTYQQERLGFQAYSQSGGLVTCGGS